jgi:hypothetical protein
MIAVPSEDLSFDWRMYFSEGLGRSEQKKREMTNKSKEEEEEKR